MVEIHVSIVSALLKLLNETYIHSKLMELKRSTPFCWKVNRFQKLEKTSSKNWFASSQREDKA